MKRLFYILIAVAAVALAATLAFGAYTNIGYRNVAEDQTITFTGAPASNMRVIAAAETSISFIPDRDDDGVPFVIPAGGDLTFKNIGPFYGFTVDWNSGVTHIYWW
jgi:hypothetical protein